MSEPNDNPWQVFDYEVQMYFETRNALKQLKSDSNNLAVTTIRNALTESLVLHTRIIVDILISKGSGKDDIKLEDILPGWPRIESVKRLVGELKLAYGRSEIENNPCWVFNKMLAHPTLWRADSYNYYPALKQIEPLVLRMLKEIQKIKSTPILRYYLVP
ncbi:MAG: hypothetical protein ACOYZ8_08180 [Chloroflexota bacterium]